jgi:purine-cytosine permease-like protein
MGYWVVIWIAITLEEQLIFRRRMKPGYIWADWNKPSKLPIGYAALVAFLIGWAGAILCMAQCYYISPVAKLV